MIISLCIPCMNRTYTLRRALPEIIAATKASPPVEIVVINYSSTDDLDEYINGIDQSDFVPGNFLTYRIFPGREYYHSAHARNLCVTAARGEYIVQLSAEALPTPAFLPYIRERLAAIQPVWMCEGQFGRWIVCQRDEFIEAGGYDEHFTVYAPEDRDICARLHRRGGQFESFPTRLIDEIPTSNREKLRNLDTRPFTGPLWVKRQMKRAMHPIFKENNALGVLVANPGKDWEAWT